jgi:uncharacterized protein YeaO (DUF488 family)
LDLTDQLRIARVYDPREPDDGVRVLIDRLWPRGVTKAGLELTAWMRDIAPSSVLRKWYGHDPSRAAEFAEQYRAELSGPEQQAGIDELAQLAGRQRLTLLTATKDLHLSHAVILAEEIAARLTEDPSIASVDPHPAGDG